MEKKTAENKIGLKLHTTLHSYLMDQYKTPLMEEQK